MYEGIKERIYRLFEHKGIRIEWNETIASPNFCCLKIRFQPARAMTLVIGKEFSDGIIEVLLIAHEFGHVLHYESLSREDAEAAYCTIFASNHRGLENISDEGKRLLLGIEKKASQNALALLRRLGGDETILARARDTYDNWLKGYFSKAGLSHTDGDIS